MAIANQIKICSYRIFIFYCPIIPVNGGGDTDHRGDRDLALSSPPLLSGGLQLRCRRKPGGELLLGLAGGELASRFTPTMESIEKPSFRNGLLYIKSAEFGLLLFVTAAEGGIIMSLSKWRGGFVSWLLGGGGCWLICSCSSLTASC